MSSEKKGLTRRDFMQLSAAGTAALTLSGPPSFAATPKRGGTVTCGMAWLIQNPDPHRRTGTWARQCMALSWEGLTTPTSVGERVRISREKGPEAVPEVEPMLAEKWEIEKNGTRYVFHLKKGVKFHNGKELDSADVKWNWERIKDPAHRASARDFLTLFLESVETPDKYTVVANLSKPYAGFLMANAWCNTCILPKDTMPPGVIWGETPTFKPDRVAPPGTGPFEMVEFTPKQRAVFVKHKDYRISGLPYLDKVVYKIISKDQPRTMAFRAKNLDYVYGLEPKWANKVLEGKLDKLGEPIHLDKEGMFLFPFLSGTTLTLYMNGHPELGNSPFKDVRVRQALDYCIDREKICKTLYDKLMIPMAQGFHWSISPWGYEDIKPRERNIEKAKQLLKEAGYPDGLDVDFYITPTWGKNDLMAQIVQQMAKPAGFRLKITPEVGLQYWSRLRARKYHLLVYTLAKEDPMNFYYSWLHTKKEKPWNGFSPVGAKDAEMDLLLEDMAAEVDLQKRKEKFKKVVLRANKKAYFLPYGMAINVNGWIDRLKNFHPQNYYYPEEAFKEAWIEG